MATGWVKLHRKLIEWEWYNDHNTSRLFIHLLLSVNSKIGEHQGVMIPVGCVKTGRKELARQIGLSEQQIRRSLNNLQKSRDITIKATNKYSLITVAKWCEYQSPPEKTTNKRTDKQPTNAPTNNHKQEDKNKLLEGFSEKLSTKRVELLSEWLKFKSEKKQSYKPTGFKALVKSLEQFDDKWLETRLEHAMSNNWAGLVFASDNASTSSPKQSTQEYDVEKELKKYK